LNPRRTTQDTKTGTKTLQEPKTTDAQARQETPNSTTKQTLELKTSQIVQQNNNTRMLNTYDAPDNMSTKKARKGRPTKYKAIYCQQIIEYFNREHTYEAEVTHTNRKGESWTSYQTKANPVPLMCDFAQFIGTTVQTLNAWTKQFPEFLEATTHAQDLQLRHLATITGLGLYNANWSVFMAKNISSWRDKKDIEHSGQVDSSIFVSKMVAKSVQAEADEHAISRLN
jgi:hypothetical protein